MFKWLIAVGAASLALAPAAYAEICWINSDENMNAAEWVQTLYSYTDRSSWIGQSGKGYTAERIDSDGIKTYFHDMPNGGEHVYDNGAVSPWRKTSLFNWYNNNNVGTVGQANDNGPCF